MSGFITIYNINKKTVDKNLLHNLTQELVYRGPDRLSTWANNFIGMGHTLYQTTNEAQYERQPSTLDDKVWITCSARIDDRENLLNKLGMKNQINLDTTPDSHLILYAYKEWGEECLDYLLGDFSFILWDKEKEKIFAARDHFGVKQFYYTHNDKSFVACNSMHCLRQYPDVSDTLNDKAIAGYLLFGDHTWDDKSITVLNDIKSLPPAHKLIFEKNKLSIKRYWTIPTNLPLLKYAKKSDYIKHFNDILKTAIKDRIRTSSITLSMSGGMDSTAIAAMVKQLEKEGEINQLDLLSVTAVYDSIWPCEERHYAGIAAKHLNIPIKYFIGDNYPLLDPYILTTRPLEIDVYTHWLDIQKIFSTHSRVVLTGASADNLLSYSPAVSCVTDLNPIKLMSHRMSLKKLYGQTPALGIRSYLKKKFNRSKETLHQPYPMPQYLNPEFKQKIDIKEIWDRSLTNTYGALHIRHPEATYNLVSPDWNTDDIIMKSPFPFSEERDPFLDLRLVNYILSIPSLPWLFNKHILRESMKEFLPKEIINRPKTPLGAIQNKLIQERSSQWLKHWKPSPELLKYIDPLKIKLSFKKENSEINTYQFLRIVTLDQWLQNFRPSS